MHLFAQIDAAVWGRGIVVFSWAAGDGEAEAGRCGGGQEKGAADIARETQPAEKPVGEGSAGLGILAKGSSGRPTTGLQQVRNRV